MGVGSRSARLACVIALALSCASRGRDRAERDDGLARADAAWRPEVAGFEAGARATMVPLIRSRPDDPQVIWRHVRLLVAEGLATTDPIEARDKFSQAREEGVRCLDGDPIFRRRREAMGWSSALSVLTSARTPCADQLAWAWVRWWIAADPRAMSLDEPALRALTDRAQGDNGGWARALFRLRSRSPDPRGHGELLALAEQRSWDLALQVDLILYGELDPRERSVLARQARTRARENAPRDGGSIARLPP
ncbi:MAG: hypothetical protein EA397_14725 [Deltaproteobacteria bacterium]|nr:MAG: hypothetical protein EA397_14725 [Deltaproteobacteria bacterium]